MVEILVERQPLLTVLTSDYVSTRLVLSSRSSSMAAFLARLKSVLLDWQLGSFVKRLPVVAVGPHGTSAVANGQKLAFRTIFLFHEAHRAFQKLLSYRTVHDVGHVLGT